MSQEFSGPTLEEALYELLLKQEYYWEKVPVIVKLEKLGTDKALEMMEKYLYRELPYGGHYQGCDYGATCECVRAIVALSDSKTPEAIERVKKVLLPALVNGNRAARKQCVHELMYGRFCSADTLEKAHELLEKSEAAQDGEMVRQAKFLIRCIEGLMSGRTLEKYIQEIRETGIQPENGIKVYFNKGL
jgi:hypothetical protein